MLGITITWKTFNCLEDDLYHTVQELGTHTIRVLRVQPLSLTTPPQDALQEH